MKINGRPIDPANKPYVIAEISCNHNGSLENAIQLVRAAHWAEADAVKVQCYDADSMTLDCDNIHFRIQDGLWKGEKLYDLYKRAATPHHWMRPLFNAAKDIGITIFASVFDRRGIDLLESLDCPAYKIASFEIVDTPLIEYAASTKKPLIISTGLATDDEIMEANDASRKAAAFLHCTSEYPASVEHAALRRISELNILLGFKNLIGVSDHTADPTIIPIAATALRASIIEKHMKLPGDDLSEDAEFSLAPSMFRHMSRIVALVHRGMDSGVPNGNPSRQFRRSLYAAADIKKGEIFTDANIQAIRPGFGAAPRYLPRLLGNKSKRAYRRGDPIKV